MTDQPPATVPSLLPYEQWIEEALRQVVVRAIEHVIAEGMPGEHHFYITFRTQFPGVSIPPRLLAQYPEEMTIVLQHQFRDLQLLEDGTGFSVGLSFGGIASTLVIPFAAVTGFVDPAAQRGLRFTAIEPDEFDDEIFDDLTPDATTAGAIGPDSAPAPAPTPQVVSLDAFRRRKD